MSCIILHVFAGKSEVWGRGGGLVVSLVGADVLGVQQVHGDGVGSNAVPPSGFQPRSGSLTLA